MLGIDAWDTSDLQDNVHYFFMWDDNKIEKYNTYAHDTFESTVKYIASHYAFNKNNKSNNKNSKVINFLTNNHSCKSCR